MKTTMVRPSSVWRRLAVTSVTFLSLCAQTISAREPDPACTSYAECLDQRARALVDVSHATTLARLSNGSYRTFGVPSTHRRGASSVGMYRYQTTAGASRLIKVIRFASERTAEANLLRQVRGMVAAAEIGGPAIHRAGRLNFDETPEFYVEMDELMPGRHRTYTLKGLYLRRDTFRAWLHPFKPSEAQLRATAALMRLAIERNLVIEDPDLIFDEDSGVQWIDGADWHVSDVALGDRYVSDPEVANALLHPYAHLLNLIYHVDAADGQTLALALKREISDSAVLTAPERFLIWSRLRVILTEGMGWTAAGADNWSALVSIEAPTWFSRLGASCGRLLER